MGSPKFYVASPLGDRTAGPEALTQLVDAIRRRGVEAYLVPMYNFRGRRNDPEYDIYDFSVVDRIPKSDDAHFVMTEVSPIESYRELRTVPKERTWVAWLSINFSPDPRARYFRPSEACCRTFPPETYASGDPLPYAPVRADYDMFTAIDRGAFATTREAASRVGGFRRAKAVAIEDISIRYARRISDNYENFITQSYYGQGFLRSVLGREAHLITDPIRVVDVATQQRERDLVVYNGSKGQWMVPRLVERMPDVRFVPLEKMTYVEVCEMLSRASLYVELGNLPGRDRLPREAAHFGTPVAFVARGSAYCWADAPVPTSYRVPYREDWADLMAPVIRRILDDPDQAVADQASYREWVAGEPERYEAAIDAWLTEALTR
jgi:hypothetical protein